MLSGCYQDVTHSKVKPPQDTMQQQVAENMGGTPTSEDKL